MCARFTLRTSAQAIQRLFDLDEVPDIEPRYNVAPTQDVLAVAEDAKGERKVRMLRWGLVPNWAKDPAIGTKMINAKSETVSERPAYRQAFEKRRCLIPADGFFEWTDPVLPKSPRQPYRIRLKGEEPFAFAGLYEYWFASKGAEPLVTCTLLTTEPNAVVEPLHDRMPVILDPADYGRWLDRKTPGDKVRELLRPFPAEVMEAYPVTTKMNRATYEEADIVEPIELPARL